MDAERRRLADARAREALPADAAAAAPAAHSHYLELGLARDFGADELKKAYRSASRSAHPDRHGGSTAAFERVSAAHDALGDAAAREGYDRGDDLDRGLERDGTTQGPPFSEGVLRRYFPEDFPFEPFGDPYEHKRAAEQRRPARSDPGGNQSAFTIHLLRSRPNIHVAAAAPPRPVSAEYPRRGRGAAATRLHGISASRPRRHNDPSAERSARPRTKNLGGRGRFYGLGTRTPHCP